MVNVRCVLTHIIRHDAGVQLGNRLFRFLVVSAGLVVLLVTIALKLRSGDL